MLSKLHPYTRTYLFIVCHSKWQKKKTQKTNSKHARALAFSLALALSLSSYSLSVNAADYFGIFCATPCMCITYIH